MNFFSIGRLIMSSLFKKEATLAYPVKRMPKDELVRGHVACDIESCIFCGMCQRKCPTHAITVIKEEKAWEISRFQCIVCNCCVEICPKKCLHMRNELTPASDHCATYKIVSNKSEVSAIRTESPHAQTLPDSSSAKDTVKDARVPADA